MVEVVETPIVNLKVKYLQVHVPHTMEEDVLKTVRAFPNGLFGQKD